MEDIVAIKVIHGKGKKDYFLTWGRTFAAVDHRPLLKTLSKNLGKYGIANIKRICLLNSLKEVYAQMYFFEQFFAMTEKRIPRNQKYDSWRKQMNRKISNGEEVYKISNNHPVNKSFRAEIILKR